MTGDPHIDEIRRHRDGFAARFGYDVAAIGRELEARHAELKELLKRAAADRPEEDAACVLPAEMFVDLEETPR